MPIEFAIKILLILLQFKGLVFFSWLQSVTVSIFHVRHSVNYYYEEDDDHIDDDNDDDDDDLLMYLLFALSFPPLLYIFWYISLSRHSLLSLFAVVSSLFCSTL